MTNHKEHAKRMIDDAADEYTRTGGPIRENVTDWLAFAQVHATLYLAEQQRIANLIAYWQLHTPRTVEESCLGNQIEVKDIETNDEQSVDVIVREGLGLA